MPPSVSLIIRILAFVVGISAFMSQVNPVSAQSNLLAWQTWLTAHLGLTKDQLHVGILILGGALILLAAFLPGAWPWQSKPAQPVAPTFQVVSRNQSGGQTALNITNVSGPLKRTLRGRDLSTPRSRLSPYVGQPLEVMGILGDGESLDFAQEVMDFLKGLGWAIPNPVPGQATLRQEGIVIYFQSTVAASPALLELGNQRGPAASIDRLQERP